MYYGLGDMRITRRLQFKDKIRYQYYGFRCVLPASLTPIGIRNTLLPSNIRRVVRQKYFIVNNQLPLYKIPNKVITLYSRSGKVVARHNELDNIQQIRKRIGAGILIAEEK